MVKKLMKFFAYLLFFIFALAMFMPKSSFYFLAEENLKKFDVVISNERLHSDILSLHIENLDITTKGIDSALVKEADVTLLLFYNHLALKEIKLSSIIEAYAPSKIESLDIKYTIVNPLVVEIESVGEFGTLWGSFNIKDRNLTLSLKPSKKMLRNYKKTMRMLKKSENGEYVYAKTF